MVNDLAYLGIKFPDSKKITVELKKYIYQLMLFVMKMIWFALFMYQIKKLKNL